jgi:hypothetical protein
MTCPGCDAHTSTVLSRFRDERPCPYCGLSYEAIAEVLTVRKRGANDELTARCEALVKESASKDLELRILRWRIREIENAFKRDPGDLDPWD